MENDLDGAAGGEEVADEAGRDGTLARGIDSGLEAVGTELDRAWAWLSAQARSLDLPLDGVEPLLAVIVGWGAWPFLTLCVLLAVLAVLSRSWRVAAACAGCAVLTLAIDRSVPSGALGAPARLGLLALPGLVALLSVLAVRSAKRRQAALSREWADAEQRIVALTNAVRAERFWRFATGDERKVLPDDELSDLARKVQASILVSPDRSGTGTGDERRDPTPAIRQGTTRPVDASEPVEREPA